MQVLLLQAGLAEISQKLRAYRPGATVLQEAVGKARPRPAAAAEPEQEDAGAAEPEQVPLTDLLLHSMSLRPSVSGVHVESNAREKLAALAMVMRIHCAET